MKVRIEHDARYDYDDQLSISIQFRNAEITAADFVKLQGLVKQITEVTQPYFDKLAASDSQEDGGK